MWDSIPKESLDVDVPLDGKLNGRSLLAP